MKKKLLVLILFGTVVSSRANWQTSLENIAKSAFELGILVPAQIVSHKPIAWGIATLIPIYCLSNMVYDTTKKYQKGSIGKLRNRANYYTNKLMGSMHLIIRNENYQYRKCIARGTFEYFYSDDYVTPETQNFQSIAAYAIMALCIYKTATASFNK